MTTIINLTQHGSSKEQIDNGVIDLAGDDLAVLKGLLTFDEIPTPEEMDDRGGKIASLLPVGTNAAMIGGAPFFMPILEEALRRVGITPLYAFTKRIVVENPQTGEKTSVFKHGGFIEGRVYKVLDF